MKEERQSALAYPQNYIGSKTNFMRETDSSQTEVTLDLGNSQDPRLMPLIRRYSFENVRA